MKPRWVAALTALHAAVAAAAISPAFFYLNVGTARRVFGGSNGETALLEDVRAYHDYASRTMAGEIPYRDFLVEYPVGAMPVFLLPRCVAPTFAAYRWAFAAEMMVVDGILVALIAGCWRDPAERRRALIWYSLSLGLLGALPIARFDLMPAALAFGAALSWSRGRCGFAGVLAGVGGIVKLFPLAAVLPGGVDSVPGRLRGFASLILTVGLGVAAWMILGQAGVARSMRYHAGRGLEIESVWASFLMVAAHLLRWPLAHDFNHSSVELITPLAGVLAGVSLPMQVMGLAIVVYRFRKAPRPEFIRFAGASVVAFATLGKVLSPQYMLWCLPFVMALPGRAGRYARPLMLACCGLSSLAYFWAGVGLLSFHPLAVGILLARNLGMLALLGVFLFIENRNGSEEVA